MLCHSNCALQGLFLLNCVHVQTQAAHLWSAVLLTLPVTDKNTVLRVSCYRVHGGKADLRFLKRRGNKKGGREKKKKRTRVGADCFLTTGHSMSLWTKTQVVMDTGLLYSLNMFHIQGRPGFHSFTDNCGKMLPKVSKAGQAKTCTQTSMQKLHWPEPFLVNISVKSIC